MLNLQSLAVSTLAFTASASPLIVSRTGTTNKNNTYINANGLEFTHFNQSLPNITVLATGGTIAGMSPDKTSTTNYDSGALPLTTLLEHVSPAALTKANIAPVQFTNVGSGDVSTPLLLNLSHTLHRTLCNDPTMSAAVVTHGTDTLEESAFFIDATVNCRKPIVFVGSMRPATAYSSDGPMNLLQAISVAADSDAKDRGTVIVMNDRIVSAFFATKTQANTVDTFLALDAGNLGMVVSDRPFWFYPAAQPYAKEIVDVGAVNEVPRVDILFAYEGMSADLLYAAVEHGAKGVVIAGAGAGGVSSAFDSAIDDVITKHRIPVVKSHRTVDGEVPTSALTGEDAQKQIASGFLNPQHSRVLLGLLLAQGKGIGEIREVFAKAAVA